MFSGLATSAFGLMASCVVVHAIGMTTALRWLSRNPWLNVEATISAARPRLKFLRWNWLFVRLAAWIIFLHGIEITIWAYFFFWRQAMPDLQSSIYFSAATYTTTGYGDLVPQGQWRLLAGIEALTGILMAGWSTGFFFAFVSRMLEAQTARTGS